MKQVFTVKMPDIGEGVVEGEVIEWLKKEGDLISQDEPVVTVMTDKATVELPSPKQGKLLKQYYQAGQIAIKDRPLYDIELEQEQILPQEKQPKEIPVEKKTQEPEKKKSQIPHHLAAPHTRRLAKTLSVDIDQIQGSGEEGRVTDEDVVKAHQKQTLERPIEKDQEIPLKGVKRLMAEKMKESLEHIPHFSYFEKVEAARLVAMKEKFKQEAEKRGISLTYMPFLIRALSKVLEKFPFLNSSLDEEKKAIICHKRHHVGIAFSSKDGLIVPVLKDVQKMGLNDIIYAFHELKEKALSGKLSPSDMKDATITISNFGVFSGHGLFATPVINYPEAAILAVSKIHSDVVVKNGEPCVCEVLNLSWSFDHRIIDGAMAAEASACFCSFLQNPASLL